MSAREAEPDWDDLDNQWDDLAGTWIRGTVVDRGVTRHAGFPDSENWGVTRVMVWGGKSWYLAGALVSSRFKPDTPSTRDAAASAHEAWRLRVGVLDAYTGLAIEMESWRSGFGHLTKIRPALDAFNAAVAAAEAYEVSA